MEVFEGFSKALLPYMQSRSIDETKQLIDMARGLTIDEAGSERDG